MARELPAITRAQLIRLLEADGWALGRTANHGVAMTKVLADGFRHTTIIPRTRGSLATGTLHAIIGLKQTQLGRDGLLLLIERYGL